MRIKGQVAKPVDQLAIVLDELPVNLQSKAYWLAKYTDPSVACLEYTQELRAHLAAHGCPGELLHTETIRAMDRLNLDVCSWLFD